MVRKGLKEQDLLQQIMQGNTVAMKEFYNIYSGYLTRYALDIYLTERP